MDINTTISIEIRSEPRPVARLGAIDADPFGSLIVNGRHIWRFDNIEQATNAAGNLKLALEKAYKSGGE